MAIIIKKGHGGAGKLLKKQETFLLAVINRRSGFHEDFRFLDDVVINDLINIGTVGVHTKDG
jgi:hypothetical protein